MGEDNGEQLISFFLYSLFIYPITNYLISPHRSYPKWKGALYAITFLLGVAVLHMLYENSEAGLNHYQILNLPRDASISAVKKAYRGLSLELHPDKNKSPEAVDQFHRVKSAFDVLVNLDKRKEYNRLGDFGVNLSAQAVIDHRYLIVQLLVYYVSSGIFAFLMTFSEPNGDAMSYSFFILAVMLMIEVLFVLQEVQLPSWFLPFYTPHEMISVLRRLFPAFMNASRSVVGAFYYNKKDIRVEALQKLADACANMKLRCENLTELVEINLNKKIEKKNQYLSDGDEVYEPIGIIDKTVKQMIERLQHTKDFRKGLIQKKIDDTHSLLKDFNAYMKYIEVKPTRTTWTIIRNFLLFLLIRYVVYSNREEVK